jgi:hypothetical protein
MGFSFSLSSITATPESRERFRTAIRRLAVDPVD